MANVNVYINFNGNCEEAFLFYQAVFGGEFTSFVRFAEMPSSEEYQVPEKEKNNIMHVVLPIGSTVLMGSDVGGGFTDSFAPGNNFSVNISPNNRTEAEQLFNGLAQGGQVTMPLSDTFWGAYFGMLTDKFGIQWMVNLETDTPQ